MATTITPSHQTEHHGSLGNVLRVMGEIDDVLLIPASGGGAPGFQRPGTYYIAVSDGSLIRAVNDPEDPAFCVVKKGRARIVIDNAAPILVVAGDVDWVSVASNCNAVACIQETSATLPLFE